MSSEKKDVKSTLLTWMNESHVTSYRELADILGVSPNTIDTWKSRGSIPERIILKYTQMKEIREIEEINQGVQHRLSQILETDQIVEIKYFQNSYGAMGEGGVVYDTLPSVMSFDKNFLINTIGIANYKGLFIINAVGNSMSPTIEDNSKLFISPFENEGNTFVDGGVYVIYAPQSGYLVKRVMLNSLDGSITLKSDNKEYDNITMTSDVLNGCDVIGRVVGNFNSRV